MMQKKKLQLMLQHDRRTIRNFNSDPAANEHAVMLDEVLDELDELRDQDRDGRKPGRR